MASREELVNLGTKHLIVGLIFTWIAGFGRYWDHPNPELIQYLGFGSVIYVIVLAGLIYLIILPLKPKDWTYFRVLTFITLTSPLAFLYAIPVEQYCDMQTAISLNKAFLAVVAIWRVALLVLFLHKLARLNFVALLTGLLLPLMFIVNILTALNLEKAVFNIMGGIRDHTANDGAYALVWLLSMLSVLGFIPVLIIYGFSIWFAHKKPMSISQEQKTPNS
jgi:hypothetical protein